MTKVERDFGNGNLQVAYEYGYNGDGAKVSERKYITPQHWGEYRFIGCGEGCTGGSLSLYGRAHINGQTLAWRRVEEYVDAPTALVYGVPTEANAPVAFVLYPMLSGHVVHYAGGQMVAPYYMDSGGMQVGGHSLPVCAQKRDWEAGCVPYPVVPNPELPYPYEPPGVGLGDIPRPIPRIPELPENPIPGLPNPTGPINVGTGFGNAMCGTMQVIPVARSCNDFVYNTDEGASWCIEHPKCNGNAVCCVKDCARILGVNPEEVINDWVDAYKKLWGCIP